MSATGRLLSRYTQDLPAGELQWIGLRPARKAPMQVVDKVMALADLGLEGDRRCKASAGSARQVTIISREYIEQIGHYLGKPVDLEPSDNEAENVDDAIPDTASSVVRPALLRRNLVVAGINLSAIRFQRIRIGDAVFETTALCHPCARMEQVLGAGGVAAMLGHGGLCAKIVSSGLLQVGDAVEKINDTESLDSN